MKSKIQRVAVGLAILAQYDDHIAVEHDVIWAGPQGYLPEQFTAEDREKLEKLGWIFDEDLEGYMIFV